MKRRWICTECDDGILAPSRMRKLDPRRFCLQCSAKKGARELVARACPANEKKRAVKAAKRAKKSDKAKAKKEALPYAQRHDLIRKDFAKLLKLPEWRSDFRRDPPKLDKIRNRGPAYTTGHCWYWSRRITITVGKKQQRDDVIEVMIHELAHAYCGSDIKHGPKFKSVNLEMRQQAAEAGIYKAMGGS